MTDRPILRFPNPENAIRAKGRQSNPPKPKGPGRAQQGARFQTAFDRLTAAFRSDDPLVALRLDPTGIAPERALVFVTAGRVANFAKVAREAGLEVFCEEELEAVEDYPEGFQPAKAEALSRTLYATIPTLASFQKMLSLWKAYQRGESARRGESPWLKVFDLLLELRPWGPQDRLGDDARNIIEDRLAFKSDDDPIAIEFEIWPTASATKRVSWREELELRIVAREGAILDRSSISEDGFVYEALLAELPCSAVREMLADPGDLDGLATLEGVQFILPQTIGQALPAGVDGVAEDRIVDGAFDPDAPIRAALLDGTPVAAHRALDGGVVVEDMHDLVRLSTVAQRFHATAMASLILRGDLRADGAPLTDTRLISVPILIDQDNGHAETARDRLFVDAVHTTLMQLIAADEPAAPDVFVVNFSIGVPDGHFSGRMSALARLMDWWAAKEGLLFVISAGNVGDLTLPETTTTIVEDAPVADRRALIRAAIRDRAFGRALLSPAESLNALTVGALSLDLAQIAPPRQAGILRLEEDGDFVPQMTSALGLGFGRSIKPDFLEAGGCQEVYALPRGADVSLRAVKSGRTGLIAASPPGQVATQKSRGTSPAAALVTRSILRAAAALTGEGGPYQGLELSRRRNALLTRALAINAAKWPQDALDLYSEEKARLGSERHARAKEEVCRQFGHGYLESILMRASPEAGVTLVGLGSIRKDRAQIFRIPAPPSLSGEKLPRTMRVTLAWFSPVNPSRAQYRLAALEAAASDDDGWGFDMKPDDTNIIKHGSVWSKRLKNRIQTIPTFGEDAEIRIRVQCRDASGGGLSQDEDIEFAIVVTLQVEAEVQFDIHQEIEQALRIRLGRP
jgi:hypothetical protein